MAVPTEATFWLRLLTIALGTGLLKPNISAMVGKLYATEDTRRDAGFTLFYMGINLGSLLALAGLRDPGEGSTGTGALVQQA